ncbi:acetamidase/formamidase family protein [Salinicoccus luteus]|uniref:acetamidase/formamidase family protein n=1 Tax=Salinicoccus luteus TaxID=367840 RepID=UPI0004E0E6AE|nr:acetamidase/formamidase family protein [Salinicoccus luteus]
MKHSLDKSHFYYAMSKDNEAALEVGLGDTVEIGTHDCFQGQITSSDAVLDTVDWDRINPATGPIYIEGIRRGDVLKVTIEDISLDERGVMLTGPGLGVMGEQMEGMEAKLFDVDSAGGNVSFNGLELPLNPMIGVIGVAPEGDPVNNGTPDRHGGNMDSKKITAGAELYLPVFHDGALFGLGDVHAKMGDGEISVSGLEIGANITVTLDKAHNMVTRHPVVIDADGIYMMVSHESLDVAVEESVRQMIALLHPHTDLNLSEITMLMSLAGETQINQVVDPLKTARFFVPKSILDHYKISFG